MNVLLADQLQEGFSKLLYKSSTGVVYTSRLRN